MLMIFMLYFRRFLPVGIYFFQRNKRGDNHKDFIRAASYVPSCFYICDFCIAGFCLHSCYFLLFSCQWFFYSKRHRTLNNYCLLIYYWCHTTSVTTSVWFKVWSLIIIIKGEGQYFFVKMGWGSGSEVG